MSTADPPPFDGGEVRWGVIPTDRNPLPFFPSRQGRGREISLVRSNLSGFSTRGGGFRKD
jgi:hypothetical protein